MYDKSAKSLRWLANQFPAVETPKDDTDRISACIHLYCTAGADAIEALTAELAALQAENAELKKRVEAKEAILRLYESTLSLVSGDKNTAIHRMRKSEVTLSRMKAERNAAIADISHVCPTCGQFQGGDCPVLFYKDYPKDCEHWRWRGVQGEV